MEAKTQQILGFFIEEARDHLNTIEKGLMDLQATMDDPEQANEMFRAAHSVKGGAAMLGFTSIQMVSHRMEDCFKIIKDKSVTIDNQVESMFLQGFDALHFLFDKLQNGSDLQDAEAQGVAQAVEPVFSNLQTYLDALANGGTPPALSQLPSNFSAAVTDILKEMLQSFKQPDAPATRGQLKALCDRLGELAPDVDSWQTMIVTARDAVGNTQCVFTSLAPVIIKELKTASDLLQAGRAQSVVPSTQLKQLAEGASASAPASGQSISIPADPAAAAEALSKVFDRQQLETLARALIVKIKNG